MSDKKVSVSGCDTFRRSTGLRLTAILTNEAVERFAAYGLRALLILYLKKALQIPEGTSIAIYSTFIALCYFSPLLGGYLADTVMGKWLTIIVFNVIYIAGALILGATAFTPEQVGAFVGLFLIAVGTGGIKPNVSAFGAEQIDKKNKGLRDSFFNIFYWCINIGSALAFLTMPVIRKTAGYGWAYMTSFFAVVLALTIFVIPIYKRTAPAKESAWSKLWRVFNACCARKCAKRGEGQHHALKDEATDTELDAESLTEAYKATGSGTDTGSDQGSPSTATAGAPAAAVNGGGASSGSSSGESETHSLLGTGSTSSTGTGSSDSGTSTDGTAAGTTLAVRKSSSASSSLRLSGTGRGVDEDDEEEDEEDVKQCSCINGARGWGKTSATEIREVRAVLKLLPIFSILPLFWAIFDSQGSIWTLQRTHMNNCIGKLCMEPEQLGILNPLLVIVLVPIFDQGIFPLLSWLGTRKLAPETNGADSPKDGNSTSSTSGSTTTVATAAKPNPAENPKHRNILYPTPLRRMGAGMQIAAISFFMTAGVQAAIDKSPKDSVNVAWQVPQFVVLTVAEICVSITGLEFAYNQAPRTMRSTVLSLYLVSVAIGNLLTGVVYAALSSLMTPLQLILMFAVIMCIGGIVFIFLAVSYRPAKPQREHDD